jgi:poly(3-hydroxybutyrate) depolymerase
MTRSRSLVHLVIWSAVAVLSVAGCAATPEDTGVGGQPGTGGSGQGGAASGVGGRGTGGQIEAGTGGKPGTGGARDAGVTGSGGSGVDAGGSGGSAGGTGGRGTGGTGPAGTGGAGAAGTGGAGAAGTGGSGTSGMSAGCGKAPSIASNQYNNGKPISIMAANMQRRYILSVPTNYDNKHAYRLVISFHQRDGNDMQNYSWQYYNLLPLANNTTIFVAPNGQLNGAPCAGTINMGEMNCGWPNPNNSDIALADAVVAQIEENFCVDTNRIFATGWSFGAAMSYETSCARPLGKPNGYIRGIAIYSGSTQITAGSCPPGSPVAFYGSHGTNDPVLPYSQGLSIAQNYATANGCTWATPPQATGSHICTSLKNCMTGYPLEFCSFVGGHTPFPDTGASPGSWGPGEAWKFISQF